MTARILAILLAAIALTFTGCAVVAVGAAVGGVAYLAKKGDLQTDLDSSIFRTVDAVNESFDEMRFRKTGQERVPAAGSRPEVLKLFATDPEGRPVKVTIKPATPFTTSLAINPGGGPDNKERAEKILATIKRHL